jgi:hypothetical protein
MLFANKTNIPARAYTHEGWFPFRFCIFITLQGRILSSQREDIICGIGIIGSKYRDDSSRQSEV